MSETNPATVLIVDDEAGMREFLSICLGRQGYAVQTASSGGEALRMLGPDHNIDLVVTDLTMPGVDGMEVLRHARSCDPEPVVIMITAYATADTAVEAMKLGAADYLLKPFKVDEIALVVARALERTALERENRRLRQEISGVAVLDRMVGRAPAMQRVFEMIHRVAPTKTSVLIRGESGTGKELVARALHNLSDRRGQPFVPVNCGAIPHSLMESELFGHVRGAFTGADHDRQGVFAAASTGTLFLDEIGELDLSTQVKLLRVLQDRKVRPVGASREQEIDARVVAATNRDLESAVEAGEFRQDLYFRLNVVQIVVPPLRHRRDDIPLLIDRFLQRFAEEMGRPVRAVSPEAMRWLLGYDYPGNVRELENLIERLVALETSDLLTAEHLPNVSVQAPELTQGSGGVPFPDHGIQLDAAVADLERSLITAALDKSQGVRKQAAELLGISMRSLRYRLQKLGLSASQDESE